MAIVKIHANNTGDGKKSTSSEAGGLLQTLYLCVGALVILTTNIAQNMGLCNGATGKVVAIIYDESSPPPGLPFYVIVDFGSKYTGPPFFGNQLSRAGYVPIFPHCSDLTTPSTSSSNLSSHSQTMLPLHLCYAWTVWKVQGQTLKGKVVALFRKKEKEHGLTSYTIFYECKRLLIWV